MYDALITTGSSPLHGVDPRVRLLAAAAAAICFSFIKTLPPAWLCLALGAALLAAARPSVSAVAARLLAVNAFIAFLWLTLPLSVPGESVLALGPLNWSAQGLSLALMVTLKANAIVLFFMAMLDGMSIPLMGNALKQLHVPPKLVFLFLFTYRYIHVIGEEWRRLRASARLRGFVPATSLHTYKTVAHMLALTFINSMDRSRRIYEAMLLRGFDGVFRTVTPAGNRPGSKALACALIAAPLALAAFDIALGTPYVR